MGHGITQIVLDLLTGIEPFFNFLQSLWSAFPLPYRFVFALLFGVAITFVIIRNIIL